MSAVTCLVGECAKLPNMENSAYKITPRGVVFNVWPGLDSHSSWEWMATGLSSPMVEPRSHQWPPTSNSAGHSEANLCVLIIDRQWREDAILRKNGESRGIRTWGSSWPRGMNLRTDGLWPICPNRPPILYLDQAPQEIIHLQGCSPSNDFTNYRLITVWCIDNEYDVLCCLHCPDEGHWPERWHPNIC